MTSTSSKSSWQLPPELRPQIYDLPGDLSHVAEIVERLAPGQGVDITLAIAKEFKGTYTYWHGIDSLDRKRRDRLIRKMRDAGYTVQQITRQPWCNINERRVWEVLNEVDEEGENGQLKLF